MSRLGIAVFASAVLMAGGARAATLYVATSGNDANSGTLAAPLRTITRAAALARPGDAVEVRGGVYNEVVKISSRGTSSARIAFRPYGSERPVIDGQGSAAGTNLVQLNSAEYVDFSGFEVRNATRIGICGWGAKNIRVRDNEVHHTQRGGIYFGYSSFGSTYDLLIENNDVHDTVLENQYHTMSGGWAQAIGLESTNRATVRGNDVHENDGEGIAFILSDNGLAFANDVSDNYSVGIYLDNAQTTTVDSNFVYSTGNTRYYRAGHPAAGIGAANETYASSNPLNANLVTNNIVVNTRWGFYYGAYGNGGGLGSTTVANNTFYRATQTMLWLDSGSHTGSIIENNVFSQAGGAPMTLVDGNGALFRANLWYGGNAGAAAGAGDILADPQLAAPGQLDPAGYALRDGSPARDRGISVSTIAADFWGNARGLLYDLGAHEAVSSAPAADSSAPSAPGSLRVTGTTATSVSLAWNASTDDTGVARYEISRNGAVATAVTGTSWTDASRTSSTTYTYSVVAIDAAGNRSPASSVQATTASAADTTPPTVPSGLRTTSVTSSSIAIAWNASTDAGSAVRYRVYRNGALVATVSGTGFTASGLAASTRYDFAVSAVDAAGNESARSTTLSATTARASKAKRRAA
jgi:parallel beta-helix repeat protein